LLEQPLLAPSPATPGLRTAALLGLGHTLAGRVVGSTEIAERLGLDESWITRRTGIGSRRYAAEGETLTGLATRAGRAALEDAGCDAADLDLVLVATMSPDRLCPNAAPGVAHRLGAAKAGAMDIGAACTGWVAALSLATAQVEAGRAERVLVIGAEVLSKLLDPDDRRTAPLFADGAGAAVIGPGDAAIGPVVLRQDGSLGGAIFAEHHDQIIRMDGHETFKAAVSSLSDNTVEACRLAGVTLDSIDVFVYHQANRRILTAVAERLGLPEHRLVDVIGETGNTSAASVPLALSMAREAGQLRAGDRVLVAAVGAGFTSGAAVMDWGIE
jgi:3-oxoacyl-[acyl-carrier-protein] synthase-3